MQDSEGSGPRGPESGATPARGLLSLEPKPIRCRDCGAKIGGAAENVRITGRTRADYSELQAGELGAWCDDCKVLTVYRILVSD